MNPKVSVIIPCFNVSQYVPRAMNCLLNQTLGFDSLQVILVDDASTDECTTKALLQDYERQYPEQVIFVPLSQNMRQGGARNAGLDYATGEYITFLDADDWFLPEALERLYSLACQYQCDVIEFKIRDISDPSESILHFDLDQPPIGLLYDILSAEERKQFIMSNVSNKGIKKFYLGSFIRDHHIRFAEHVAWEEPSFSYIVQFYETRHMLLQEELYESLRHDGSTMKSSYENKKMHNCITIQTLYQDLLNRGLYMDYSTEIDYIFFHWYFVSTFLFATMYHVFFSMDEFLEIQQKTRETVPFIRENPYYLESFSHQPLMGDLVFCDATQIGIENIKNFFENYYRVYQNK